MYNETTLIVKVLGDSHEKGGVKSTPSQDYYLSDTALNIVDRDGGRNDA